MAYAARSGPGGPSLRGGVRPPFADAGKLMLNATGVKAYLGVAAVSVAINVRSHVAVLTKGSAGAYTLAAPVADTDDGVTLVITAGTAFAHVVTATALVQDGITGGAKTTCTFAAFLGATLTLVAYQATWYVVSKNVVTIT